MLYARTLEELDEGEFYEIPIRQNHVDHKANPNHSQPSDSLLVRAIA
jgi:hypothetical protein